jgi:oxidase EvaA
MDARTVLACLPLQDEAVGGDEFGAMLARSRDPRADAAHGLHEILSWLSGFRSTMDVQARPLPLNRLRHWHRSAGRISHETGRFFDVVGVGVEAHGREVGRAGRSRPAAWPDRRRW